MEQLGKVEARKRLKVFKAYNEQTLNNMDLEHLGELDKFNEEWTQKFEMMSKEAMELKEELRERHRVEKREAEAMFFSSIKEPKSGPELLNLKTIRKKLVNARRYLDADKVTERIEELKESLELTWNNKMKEQYENLLINIETKHSTEMKSLKFRIKNAMKEQKEAKDKELRQLLTRFMNSRRGLENKHVLEIQKYKKFLEQRTIPYNHTRKRNDNS